MTSGFGEVMTYEVLICSRVHSLVAYWEQTDTTKSVGYGLWCFVDLSDDARYLLCLHKCPAQDSVCNGGFVIEISSRGCDSSLL